MFTSLGSFNFVSAQKGKSKPETTGSVASKPTTKSVETAGSLAYSAPSTPSVSTSSSASASSSSSGSFCAVA